MPAPLIEPGRFHRVAVAVDDAPAAHEWFRSLLGAGPWGGGQATDPFGRAPKADEADLAGTETRSFALGGLPFILLSKGVPGGPVANFLQRYGPGVHSLAWEIDDLWSAQNLLIERGVRMGAVNVPGRHFFMHPKDTHGILIEWTDVVVADEARDGLDGAISVSEVAWVSAAVADADRAAAFLAGLLGAQPVDGNAMGPPERERTVDVAVGGVTIRLITPRSEESPYSSFLRTGPRLCTTALRVPDLDAAHRALETAGVSVARREPDLFETRSSDTFGIALEWTR